MCDGVHPSPDYRVPWWEFTCPVCDPLLHNALTACDPEAMTRLVPRQVVCPLCLNAASYRRGIIMTHYEDEDDVPCRVTGMSQLVAKRYVLAMVNGLPVASLYDLADRPRPAPGPRQRLVGKLVRQRAMLDMRQTEISTLIGVKPSSTSVWEHDVARPTVLHLLEWISVLRFEAVLRRKTDGSYVLLAPASGLTGQLTDLRTLAGLSQRELTGNRSAVARWERGALPSLDDFLDWISALGYEFEVRELVTA